MARIDFNVEESILRSLASGYAFGLDNRDKERFADAFLPDGTLTIVFAGSNQEPSKTIGRDALLKVPAMLSIYARTMHFLGQSDYQIAENSACGVVYCIAHHISLTENGGLDHVMHMSYDDDYTRDRNNVWKIKNRTGTIHWTETRVADLPRQRS
jgi:hypothetical protein